MAYHIPGIDAIQSGGSNAGANAQSVPVNLKTSQTSESQVQLKGKGVEQISEVKENRSEDQAVLKSTEDVLEIESAVEKLNKKLESQNQDLNVGYSVDAESGKIVVRISDANNGKLVRQIPSEETLEFARNVKKGKGLLLNTKI